MILTPKLFTKNFQVGQFLFETYGVDITLEEGDNEEEVFAKAKQKCTQECMRNNPHLLGNDAPVFASQEELPSQQIEKALTPTNAIITAIMNCQTLADLNGFKILATTDKSIQAAYDLQVLKLKNKTK